MIICFFFFFSSRRRHTRSLCDWSSDVCSSDLELIAGVRSDVAVKVFGDDMDTLRDTGDSVERVLSAVRGASDVKIEQTTGLPLVTIHLKRPEMARLGLNVSDVQDV